MIGQLLFGDRVIDSWGGVGILNLVDPLQERSILVVTQLVSEDESINLWR